MRRGAAMSSCNSLLGVDHSLFGSAGFPVDMPGNPPGGPLSLGQEYEKTIQTRAGRGKFPARREFAAAAATLVGPVSERARSDRVLRTCLKSISTTALRSSGSTRQTPLRATPP